MTDTNLLFLVSGMYSAFTLPFYVNQEQRVSKCSCNFIVYVKKLQLDIRYIVARNVKLIVSYTFCIISLTNIFKFITLH